VAFSSRLALGTNRLQSGSPNGNAPAPTDKSVRGRRSGLQAGQETGSAHSRTLIRPECPELVSIRIDRAVLDHFQEDGPGWQDRINDALRQFVAAKG